MYTVTTLDRDGKETISHFFDTKKAAQNWVRWIRTKSWSVEVALYRGQAGEELISREMCM